MEKKTISKIVKPTINLIAKYIPGDSSINGNKNVIKLSSNESPFKIPKRIYNLSKKLISEAHLYPDGNSSILKKSISKTFKIKQNQIICGNGSDDILSIIAQCFANSNTEVICSQYGFIYYPIIANASGAKVIIAKTKKLGISCDNILNLITKKTRIIFFANPNNPTGTVILQKELESFLSLVPKNVVVVVDGAYAEFVQHSQYTDGLDLVKKFPNLIITRTFSKIFALAGLRLGWAYSSKNIIELLEKVRGPFNVNLIAQKIGSLILKEKKFINKSVKHNLKWQKKLPTFVNSIGLEGYGTFANFILIKINNVKLSKRRILSDLQKKKIIVRDLENYGLKSFLRVSIGTNSEMNVFMEVLKSIMTRYK